MTPLGGSHGNPHRTPKVRSHAWQRGGVAARGAGAAGGDAGDRVLQQRNVGVYAPMVAAFRQGLTEIRLRRRPKPNHRTPLGQGHNERLPALAADLVRRQVAVIIGAGTAATGRDGDDNRSSFRSRPDPVAEGLVTSLNRPGGNATGVIYLGTELVQSRWKSCTRWCRRRASWPSSSTRAIP
jgi:hypothetical protein